MFGPGLHPGDEVAQSTGIDAVVPRDEFAAMIGLTILEAMRDARPGMYEYELQADAEFVFEKHGAYGPSSLTLGSGEVRVSRPRDVRRTCSPSS